MTHARRLRRVAMAAVATGLAATALVACGGDDKSSGGGSGATAAEPAASTSGTAAKQPTGEPIKTMTIAAVNWNGPAYPNILETAKLYEKWVNDRGGIHGRPLQVETCDEMGDPNQLATCGRKAIADDVVAVIGSFTLTGDRITPILSQGRTAWFGIPLAVSPAERNSDVTFEFGPGNVVSVGEALKLVDLGCKKIGLVTLDTPSKNLGIQLYNAALATRGQKLAKVVAVPVAAADLAPQAAQITSGTDCIIGGLGETNWASFLPAFKQARGTQKLIGLQGNLDEKVAKNFGSIVKGSIAANYFADISDPAFADFRQAIAQYKPPADLDYNSAGGLGAWTGYTGFKAIVDKMTGPITNETFLAAAHATKALDTGGKVPVLDFTQEWTAAPEDYRGLRNHSVSYSVFDANGKLHADGTGFTDIADTFLKIVSPAK
jgi:ABC-type branched-subunit amino acid transport system substrate-binding protein